MISTRVSNANLKEFLFGISSVGSIIDFANLGEVSMRLAALEKNKKTEKSDMPPAATSMLVLFVKGTI